MLETFAALLMTETALQPICKLRAYVIRLFRTSVMGGRLPVCELFRDNTAQCMRSGRTFRNTGELVLLRRLRKQGNAEERPQYLASRVRR